MSRTGKTIIKRHITAIRNGENNLVIENNRIIQIRIIDP